MLFKFIIYHSFCSLNFTMQYQPHHSFFHHSVISNRENFLSKEITLSSQGPSPLCRENRRPPSKVAAEFPRRRRRNSDRRRSTRKKMTTSSRISVRSPTDTSRTRSNATSITIAVTTRSPRSCVRTVSSSMTSAPNTRSAICRSASIA